MVAQHFDLVIRDRPRLDLRTQFVRKHRRFQSQGQIQHAKDPHRHDRQQEVSEAQIVLLTG